MLPLDHRLLLADRLRSVENSSKVLNVSQIKDDGKGVKVQIKPKRTALFIFDGLDIVSNNYAAYKMATDMLGPGYEIYADMYVDEVISRVLGYDSKLITEKNRFPKKNEPEYGFRCRSIYNVNGLWIKNIGRINNNT